MRIITMTRFLDIISLIHSCLQTKERKVVEQNYSIETSVNTIHPNHRIKRGSKITLQSA